MEHSHNNNNKNNNNEDCCDRMIIVPPINNDEQQVIDPLDGSIQLLLPPSSQQISSSSLSSLSTSLISSVTLTGTTPATTILFPTLSTLSTSTILQEQQHQQQQSDHDHRDENNNNNNHTDHHIISNHHHQDEEEEVKQQKTTSLVDSGNNIISNINNTNNNNNNNNRNAIIISNHNNNNNNNNSNNHHAIILRNHHLYPHLSSDDPVIQQLPQYKDQVMISTPPMTIIPSEFQKQKIISHHDLNKKQHQHQLRTEKSNNDNDTIIYCPVDDNDDVLVEDHQQRGHRQQQQFIMNDDDIENHNNNNNNEEEDDDIFNHHVFDRYNMGDNNTSLMTDDISSLEQQQLQYHDHLLLQPMTTMTTTTNAHDEMMRRQMFMNMMSNIVVAEEAVLVVEDHTIFVNDSEETTAINAVVTHAAVAAIGDNQHYNNGNSQTTSSSSLLPPLAHAIPMTMNHHDNSDNDYNHSNINHDNDRNKTKNTISSYMMGVLSLGITMIMIVVIVVLTRQKHIQQQSNNTIIDPSNTTSTTTTFNNTSSPTMVPLSSSSTTTTEPTILSSVSASFDHLNNETWYEGWSQLGNDVIFVYNNHNDNDNNKDTHTNQNISMKSSFTNNNASSTVNNDNRNNNNNNNNSNLSSYHPSSTNNVMSAISKNGNTMVIAFTTTTTATKKTTTSTDIDNESNVTSTNVVVVVEERTVISIYRYRTNRWWKIDDDIIYHYYLIPNNNNTINNVNNTNNIMIRSSSISIDEYGTMIAIGFPNDNDNKSSSSSQQQSNVGGLNQSSSIGAGSVRIYRINDFNMTSSNSVKNISSQDGNGLMIETVINGIDIGDEFAYTIYLLSNHHEKTTSLLAIGARKGCYIQVYQYNDTNSKLWIKYGPLIPLWCHRSNNNNTSTNDNHSIIQDMNIQLSNDGKKLIVWYSTMKEYHPSNIITHNSIEIYHYNQIKNQWLLVSTSTVDSIINSKDNNSELTSFNNYSLMNNTNSSEESYSSLSTIRSSVLSFSTNGYVMAYCSSRFMNVNDDDETEVLALSNHTNRYEQNDRIVASCRVLISNKNSSSWELMGDDIIFTQEDFMTRYNITQLNIDSVSLDDTGTIIAISYNGYESTTNNDDDNDDDHMMNTIIKFAQVWQYYPVNTSWYQVGDDIFFEPSYPLYNNDAYYYSPIVLSSTGSYVMVGSIASNIHNNITASVRVYERSVTVLGGEIKLDISFSTGSYPGVIYWYIDRLDVEEGQSNSIYHRGTESMSSFNLYARFQVDTVYLPINGVYRFYIDTWYTAFAYLEYNNDYKVALGMDNKQDSDQYTFHTVPSSDDDHDDNDNDHLQVNHDDDNTAYYVTLVIQFDENPNDIHWVLYTTDGTSYNSRTRSYSTDDVLNDKEDINNDDILSYSYHHSIIAYGPERVFGSDLRHQYYIEMIDISKWMTPTSISDDGNEVEKEEEHNNTFTFVLTDDGRDGLCCLYGIGNVTLYHGSYDFYNQDVIFTNTTEGMYRFIHSFEL